LLKEGHTCWKVSNATRASLLVDGEEYFGALRQALLHAREQIVIAGWDFDSRILLPPPKNCPPTDELACAPLQLGELLGYLLRTRPGLRIDVVRWDYHWLYRSDREADTREKLSSVGVRFHEHAEHPVTGCVHYKIVVIDDVLAFCGGMDLTHHRWDTCQHDADDANRCDCTGISYMPVHDTQLCVAGPVAAHLGDYLREHWPDPEDSPVKPKAREEFWPESVPIQFENIRTGICRTQPRLAGHKLGEDVREIEEFYLAAIGATQRTMYVENQYFTSARIAQAIADRCRHQPSVEGLLVGMERPKTHIELHTMGYGRRQFHQILDEAGVSERVPLVAAMSGGRGINLHSKTAIFDDRWLTVGSANLNRRSMGFDVECNLVLEATTPQHRHAMDYLRNRLVAEHVGMSIEEVEASLSEHGLARLPNLASGSRSLALLQPLNPEPIFGPVLAPLFDRDEAWMPPASPTVQRQRGWYAPLTLIALASLLLLGEGVLKEMPSLTQIQQQLERMLDG
jgi:phosphatidylserine/phosphatidylglycerophosphate/cardiolipin synthase-like enzyme